MNLHDLVQYVHYKQLYWSALSHRKEASGLNEELYVISDDLMEFILGTFRFLVNDEKDLTSTVGHSMTFFLHVILKIDSVFDPKVLQRNKELVMFIGSRIFTKPIKLDLESSILLLNGIKILLKSTQKKS